MIWHIFKKDWKLFWPLVAIVAFAHAIAAMLWWFQDHDSHPDDLLKGLAQFLPLIALLGSAILCIFVIHADPIPGDREDWLARPIHRSDLLMSKLLFVLLAVVAPVLVIGAFEALSDGFSFVASVGAALGRSVALLVQICLPAMVLGAITRNATEAIMAAVAAGASATALAIFDNLIGHHPTMNNSGLTWWGAIAFSGVIISAALVILPLQYLRRYTASSRLLMIPFFLLALQFQTLPWNAVFSGQKLLAPKSAGGENVTITFDPSLGRSSRTAISAGVTGHASLINLPIRVDGIDGGNVLLADNAEIRLIADGKLIYHQDSAESAYSIPAFTTSRTKLRQGGNSGQPLHGYQAVLLPVSVFNRVRGDDLTLEIDYSLSLFRKDATGAVAALDDSKHFEKIGWCQSGLDDDGDDVRIHCVQPGQHPNCMSAILENPATGQRDPETFVCAPDYSPIPIHFIPDDLTRFGVELKFSDADDVTKYPIGESQLGTAHVNLTTYQPMAHFTRHVVIHNIRLGDWAAGTHETATNAMPPM